MKKAVCLILLSMMVGSSLAAGSKPSKQALAFGTSFAVLPSVANVPGLFGSVWKTKVELLNPTGSGYSIKATLYDKTGKVKDVSIDMAAGQMRSYSNLLSDLFSFGGAGTVKFDGQGDGNQFLIEAEVYTDTPNGRFKTPVEPIAYDASNAEAVSLGVTVDSTSRTNIGAFNDSASVNNISAEVYDASGALVTTVSLSLPPQSWNQIALASNVSEGYVKFIPTLPAYCFAVVVHNVSNDGSFLQAAEVGE